MKFTTINPATENKLASYACITEQDIEAKIRKAYDTFLEYKKTPYSLRASLMLKVSEILEAQKHAFAEIITKEMGKPITFALAEVEKCALIARHYVKHAAEYLKPHIIKTNLDESYVVYQPLGVIFAIMPWNFPFWQVFRFAVPNLMAGNVVILKHAPNCLEAGNIIEKIFIDAGFMANAFQHFIIDVKSAAQVISSKLVAGVTLTGSERAGREVAGLAGKNLTKSILELGGSDPYIVFADADLDLAAEQIVKSRLNNSGQVCIAAKRVILVKEIAEALLNKIMLLIAQYVVGDPLDIKTHCGPLARFDLRQEVHRQVLESVNKGAKLMLGGEIPEGKGFYYPITVLKDVLPGMPAFDDEIFGPVFAFITANNEAEAITYANKTRFGLSSVIFSSNISKAKKIAVEDIEAGSCFINTMASSNPFLPFGGIKNSGFGRELGKEGILEFVNVKTIGVKHCE